MLSSKAAKLSRPRAVDFVDFPCLHRALGQLRRSILPPLYRGRYSAQPTANLIGTFSPFKSTEIGSSRRNIAGTCARIALRQYQHEFVAAKPRRRVRLANHRAQMLGKRFQHQISRRMPKPIIDCLEFIQVKHHHRQVVMLPQRPANFRLQRAFHESPVIKSRQRIHQAPDCATVPNAVAARRFRFAIG